MIWVVGIGADGWPSLGAEARAAVLGADLLVGGDRQLALLPHDARARRRAWPAPLSALVDELPALDDGRSIVVLASGDPLLHGVGTSILRTVGAERVHVIPAVSSFALACARLRWPLGDVELVSATTGVPEVVARALQPGRRIVVFGFGAATAAQIARVVREHGCGPSRFVVLEELGGAAERIEESTADEWGDREAAALHLVALEVRGDGPLRGRGPGLPDDAYEHDGQITKRDVRAITLAALVPVPGQLLWDIGAGSGSVAIEWLRAAPGSRAVAVERDRERAARIERNALRLGVPALEVVTGESPAALDALDGPPDAIFIGGGLSCDLVARCRAELKPGGRLVANAVTVEGETIFAAAHAQHGGRLIRLAISHAAPLGGYTGWRPAMPITQWELTKP